MSEAFAERLSRFTPDASGLDRDALLFAAGRASARPSRGWVALAGALAASQVLTLVLLWPRPGVHDAAPVVAAGDSLPVESQAPTVPGPPTLWQLRDQAIETEGALPAPAPVADLIASDPPLRAFAAPPAALLQ